MVMAQADSGTWRRWLHDLKETNAELADEIHVFSTFFYKRLKTGTYVDLISGTEERY